MSTASTASSGTKRKRGSEMKFYAVRAGHKPGIYHSWNDCKEQITGFKGAVYKSFTSLTEAQAFEKGTDSTPASGSGPKKFYAVQNGREPGVYTDWPSAQKQIVGWSKPKHKSFTTRAEAEAFVAEGTAPRDGAAVFPDSPAVNGDADTPMTKKAKATKTKQPAQVPTGPGWDPLPADAEDGFDSRIIMDPVSGQLRYKTQQELVATKMMPNTDHHGQTLHIWTDGACTSNGQGKLAVGGIGVYFGPHDPRNLAEPLTGKQTNNRAELTALKRALSVAPMNRNVTIHTDSKYAIDCVTNWFQKWKNNNWKNAAGKDVENKELIQNILKIIDERFICRSKTHFEWVKGHAGNVENEAADRLAVAGAAENREKGIGVNGTVPTGGSISITNGDARSVDRASDASPDFFDSQSHQDVPMT